jgi:hypothetical protein
MLTCGTDLLLTVTVVLTVVVWPTKLVIVRSREYEMDAESTVAGTTMIRLIFFPFLFNQEDNNFEASDSCCEVIEDDAVAVLTFQPIKFQFLPPEPVEPVESNCKSSQ